jgi:hypothetical protein
MKLLPQRTSELSYLLKIIKNSQDRKSTNVSIIVWMSNEVVMNNEFKLNQKTDALLSFGTAYILPEIIS